MSNFYKGLTEEQKNSIIQYYRTPDRPPGRAQSVKWSSRYGQHLRFKILSRIGDLAAAQILDVGCGLGDLYDYLLKTAGEINYTGIDLVPEFISQAKEKYHNAKFLNTELLCIKDKFDYVLSSGSMNKKISNHAEIYKGMIKYMYDLSNFASGFNMLNRAAHIEDETYCAFDPEEILNFCQTFARRTKLITGYLNQDFTILLYH